MKKKIAFLFALTGAALLFAGCSSLQTAGTSKFNGQKITASLCRRYLNMDGLLAIAIDPSYISKSGTVAHYRVPASCSIKLTDGVNVLLQSRVPVYQLGIESTFQINTK